MANILSDKALMKEFFDFLSMQEHCGRISVDIHEASTALYCNYDVSHKEADDVANKWYEATA